MTGERIVLLLTGEGMLVPLLAFLLLGAVVFASAARLAGHADAIGDALGLGRMWAGALLLAASTSLPELATDVNAGLLGHVDIGVGDLFGSTLANVFVLGALDLAFRRHDVIARASREHATVGAVAIVLTAVATAALASGGWGRVGHVGTETLLIVAAYVLATRAVLASRPADTPSPEPRPPEDPAPRPIEAAELRKHVAGFVGAALVLLLAAPLVVLTADAFAIESGLSESAVGTLLVGFTTSFPEIAASVAAVRLGAPDLAVGNLVGSNAFNMCVLFAMDLAHAPGPVLATAAPTHLATASLAILAIALAVFAVLARRPVRVMGFRLDSLAMVGTYAAAAWLLTGHA